MKIIETRNDLLDIIGQQSIVCEIGVFKGEFSEIMIKNLNPFEIHLIDTFEGTMCSGDKDGNNIVWTNLNDEYNRLLLKYESNSAVKLHKGYSFDILNKFKDEYFDFIYIDGDHSYDGVKDDLNLSYSKTKKNGYICGHDYTIQMFEGVVRAVNEFCLENNLRINYLTKDGCPSFCIKKTN
jgi:hypothetical protein